MFFKLSLTFLTLTFFLFCVCVFSLESNGNEGQLVVVDQDGVEVGQGQEGRRREGRKLVQTLRKK